MRANQLDKFLPRISEFFDQSDKKSFTEAAFFKIFEHNHYTVWKIDINRSAQNVLAYLMKKGLMLVNELVRDHGQPTIKIYSWKTTEELTVISGLKNQSYFSHYTAISLHQLTEQIPKSIYLNREHTSVPETTSVINKAVSSVLTQEAIDAAFSKEQRKVEEYLSFKNYKIFQLNGKYTGNLGIIHKSGLDFSYSLTDLPRTLIDIVIRPAYAGGVFEVLKAYKNARDNFDHKTIYNYLNELDYIYPYHQAIGFYLQKAGYDEKILSLFEQDIKHAFYLTYNMRNPSFDSRWKIYHPKGI